MQKHILQVLQPLDSTLVSSTSPREITGLNSRMHRHEKSTLHGARRLRQEPVMHFMNTHSSHWVSVSQREGRIPACILISMTALDRLTKLTQIQPFRRLKNRIAYPWKKQKFILKYSMSESTNSLCGDGSKSTKLQKKFTRNSRASRVYKVSDFTLFCTKTARELLTTNYSIGLLKFQTNFSERGRRYNYSLIPLI